MSLALTLLTLVGGALWCLGLLVVIRLIWQTDGPARRDPQLTNSPFAEDTVTSLGTR